MVHEEIYGLLCGIIFIYEFFDERFRNQEWKKSGTIQLAKKDINDRKKL
jgi:hypothetical protein